MALTPATAMFLTKFAKNTATQLPGLLQPKFGNTAQGRYLKAVKKHGEFDQGQESMIIGDTARKANTQAVVSNKNYQGQMINRGTQDSVANIRAMKDSEANVRNQVSKTAADLYMSEQTAKKQAEKDLAIGADKVKADKRNALINILTGGASAGVESYVSGQQDKGVKDAMSKYQASDDKDPQQLFDTLLNTVGYEQAIAIMKAMAGGV
tara:strand:+ start:21016 stop:21642 length:627 start_codon:yes stop_codon:yes gene_type:complete